MRAGPRKLSALDATLFVMGGILGVGIFFTPAEVAARTGTPLTFLSVWVFGGLVAMCAAFTFAELGGSFPRTGGWFVYLREAFGPFPAFLFAWIVLFVVSTGSSASIAFFCADMLHVALPSLVAESGWSNDLAAYGLVVGVTVLALSGVKRAALAQNLCMVTKLVVLAALGIGGLVLATPAEASTSAATVSVAGGGWRGMLAALRPVFFSYGGWQMVAYIAPQIENPSRNLPRAIVLGVGGVILVYLGANAAFVGALGIEGVAQPGFAAAVAGAAFGPTGERLLAAGMAVSALGICTVILIGSPWLFVAMAKDKLFFARLGALHPTRGVPTLALVIQAAVTLTYLTFSALGPLVDTVIFVEWIFHFLVAWALLRLRRRPGLPRPFTSPFYPLAPLVYLVAAALVVGSTLTNTPPSVWATGLGVCAVGALLYLPWQLRAARSA